MSHYDIQCVNDLPFEEVEKMAEGLVSGDNIEYLRPRWEAVGESVYLVKRVDQVTEDAKPVAILYATNLDYGKSADIHVMKAAKIYISPENCAGIIQLIAAHLKSEFEVDRLIVKSVDSMSGSTRRYFLYILGRSGLPVIRLINYRGEYQWVVLIP